MHHVSVRSTEVRVSWRVMHHACERPVERDRVGTRGHGPHHLIVDELGYLACDTRAADILYNIISRRHEQRSTSVTTNLAFKHLPRRRRRRGPR